MNCPTLIAFSCLCYINICIDIYLYMSFIFRILTAVVILIQSWKFSSSLYHPLCPVKTKISIVLLKMTYTNIFLFFQAPLSLYHHIYCTLKNPLMITNFSKKCLPTVCHSTAGSEYIYSSEGILGIWVRFLCVLCQKASRVTCSSLGQGNMK